MADKIIMTIPIYGITEVKFETKYNIDKNKIIQNEVLKGFSGEVLNERVTTIAHLKNPFSWKYNQIVGYIEIALTGEDVLFEEYITSEKRKSSQSKQKKPICFKPMTNNHFRIINKSNGEIVKIMDDKLNDIQNELTNSETLDLTTYNNVKNYIDYVRIMDDILNCRKSKYSL